MRRIESERLDEKKKGVVVVEEEDMRDSGGEG